MQTDPYIGVMSEQRRAQDWPSRLSSIISNYSLRNYKWGESDCGTFACDVVRELIDVDLYEQFQGSYSSKNTYLKLLVRNQCESIADLFTQTARNHEIHKIQKGYAMRGDIVCMSLNGIQSLGVCVGSRALFHVNHGLISISMTDCHTVWAVR